MPVTIAAKSRQPFELSLLAPEKGQFNQTFTFYLEVGDALYVREMPLEGESFSLTAGLAGE